MGGGRGWQEKERLKKRNIKQEENRSGLSLSLSLSLSLASLSLTLSSLSHSLVLVAVQTVRSGLAAYDIYTSVSCELAKLLPEKCEKVKGPVGINWGHSPSIHNP